MIFSAIPVRFKWRVEACKARDPSTCVLLISLMPTEKINSSWAYWHRLVHVDDLQSLGSLQLCWRLFPSHDSLTGSTWSSLEPKWLGSVQNPLSFPVHRCLSSPRYTGWMFLSPEKNVINQCRGEARGGLAACESTSPRAQGQSSPMGRLHLRCSSSTSCWTALRASCLQLKCGMLHRRKTNMSGKFIINISF